MIHSFLLIGQSNMAGRGFETEVEKIENPRIKVLINGRWQPHFQPIHRDRPHAGVCLAESFADIYSRERNVDVGLIPCADGGTSLSQWRVHGLLFDHAVYMTSLAMRTSTVAGVLWHQGEADCSEGLYQLYEEKFTPIMRAFREELDLYDVPFLLGGLGEYLKYCDDESLHNYERVNEALAAVAKKESMCGFVSAAGLTSNPDMLHFNAASLRQFGLRYYEEFKKLEDKSKIFTDKCCEADAIRTKMEEL